MRSSPVAPLRVAVVIEASNAYARGLLSGIHRHVREHEAWNIFLPEHGRGFPPLDSLARWHGDGIIARIETKPIAGIVRKLQSKQGIPVVDVSAARLLPAVPYVETDDRAIASLAADHFLERDFRHFAFLGDQRFRWSENRRRAFVEVLAAKGHAVHLFPSSRHRRPATPSADDHALQMWLARLPKPVAVFACYDIRGRQALDACRTAGLAVPDEVAVLGVDDDELLCGLANPPLSSVIPDAVGAGRRAAELLESLMQGQTPSHEEFLLPPLGISTRQSSDTLAIDDERVAAAIRYVRDHACRGIKVADVVRSIGVARRTLEQRLADRIGHSLHEEIVRVQFRRVEQLLRETDLPLATIAERSGFRHTEYLTVAFKRRHGTAPSQWRKQFR